MTESTPPTMPADVAPITDEQTPQRAEKKRTGAIRAVRGRCLMWGIDVADPAAEVIARAREAGLLLVSAGEYTVRLLPPLVISHEDLAAGLTILERALAA